MARISLISERNHLLNRAFVALLLATQISDSRYCFEKVPERAEQHIVDTSMTPALYTSEPFGNRSLLEIAVDKSRDDPRSRALVRQALERNDLMFRNLEIEVCSSGVYISASPEPNAERIMLHYTPFHYDGFIALNDVFKRIYDVNINPKDFRIFQYKIMDLLPKRGIVLRSGIEYTKIPIVGTDYDFLLRLAPDQSLHFGMSMKEGPQNRMLRGPNEYAEGKYLQELGLEFQQEGMVLGSACQYVIRKHLGKNVLDEPERLFANELNTRTSEEFAQRVVETSKAFIDRLTNPRGQEYLPIQRLLLG